MLLNFCDPSLRPEIQCDAISTEGYEVTNLIENSDKGFLAYSCIKPPINIDITFLCNVQINHILIWPSVGPQKSSNFRLYSKTTNDEDVPYALLSTGYLNSNDSGLLFYPANIDHEKISVPSQFVKRYIKTSLRYLTSYANSLRICIFKTENSVPALGKIEVWGTVSPRCGKDVVASVHSLWLKHQDSSPLISTENSTSVISSNDTIDKRTEPKVGLDVPECFLDAITWEIMIQPVTLPSGKIIDQSTLQKHEENEALWGRPVSDPFTGIPFNEHRKPVIATALKARIDKFLVENSNTDEVKKIPRMLGHSSIYPIKNKKTEVFKSGSKENKNTRDTKVKEKVTNLLMNRDSKDMKIKLQYPEVKSDSQKYKNHCHRLPITVMCSKQVDTIRPIKRRKIFDTPSLPVNDISENVNNNSNNKEILESTFEGNLDIEAKTLLSSIKRFSAIENHKEHEPTNGCDCCTDTILYQLPCMHVVCRKVLISIEISQCKLCGKFFKPNEVERLHE